jgi:hypothetical protein
MDRDRHRFEKEITQVISQNAVKEIQLWMLPQIFNYSGLPLSIITYLVRKWSRYSPYHLENIKDCWAHLGKASTKVRETAGD